MSVPKYFALERVYRVSLNLGGRTKVKKWRDDRWSWRAYLRLPMGGSRTEIALLGPEVCFNTAGFVGWEGITYVDKEEEDILVVFVPSTGNDT